MSEAVFIGVGYLIFTLYTCGIMYLGAVLEDKTSIDPTICRKLTHIVSAFVWVICYFFFGCSLHWVILNFVGAAALGVVTFGDKFTAFQRTDADKCYGLFYFGLSTAIVALICYLVGEELYLYTGVTYYCLALGDGVAPLVAKACGKANVQIRPGKSLWGTVSVFLMSFLSAFVFSLIFRMELDIVFLLSVAALTCVTEFYGMKGTDNLFIEFFVFGYLVLNHYGLVSLPLQIVLIVSPALACLAIYSGAMSESGGICAFFLFAFVGFFGRGFVPVVFIAVLFLVSTVVSVVGKKIKKRIAGQAESHKARRAHQITAVGLFAIIALILYWITNVPIFYYLFFLALTEQIADSMASDIGCLTAKKNVSIITGKPVEKGISGGISVLGTVAALVSSFLLMVLPMAFGVISPLICLAIGLIAFVGTLADSVVGALAQSLYECDTCNALTETDMHCGKPAKLIKGFRMIDNVAVNYIAGLITCGFGFLLLLAV
ncbi:MAG: DUF92 domain-containing protein [Oscillospiraceae bacterium]|nr:DUF92 domain-containing protein [Oscillospiraceae bacterium]